MEDRITGLEAEIAGLEARIAAIHGTHPGGEG
jgi:hypothetical protein